jgi:hypothetical protein
LRKGKKRERSSHLGPTNIWVRFPDWERQPRLPWRKLLPIAILENKRKEMSTASTKIASIWRPKFAPGLIQMEAMCSCQKFMGMGEEKGVDWSLFLETLAGGSLSIEI